MLPTGSSCKSWRPKPPPPSPVWAAAPSWSRLACGSYWPCQKPPWSLLFYTLLPESLDLCMCSRWVYPYSVSGWLLNSLMTVTSSISFSIPYTTLHKLKCFCLSDWRTLSWSELWSITSFGKNFPQIFLGKNVNFFTPKNFTLKYIIKWIALPFVHYIACIIFKMWLFPLPQTRPIHKDNSFKKVLRYIPCTLLKTFFLSSNKQKQDLLIVI